MEDSVEVRIMGVGAMGDAMSTSWISGVIIRESASEGRRTVRSVVSSWGSGPDVEAERPERLRRVAGKILGVGSDDEVLGATG